MFITREVNDSPASVPADRGDAIAMAGAALANPASQNLIKDTMAAAGNTAENHLPQLEITNPDKAAMNLSSAGAGADVGGASIKPADASHDQRAYGTASEQSNGGSILDRDLEMKLSSSRVDDSAAHGGMGRGYVSDGYDDWDDVGQ